MARAVGAGDSDCVIQQLEAARACFADACCLATATASDLPALVARAKSRSLYLLDVCGSLTGVAPCLSSG